MSSGDGISSEFKTVSLEKGKIPAEASAELQLAISQAVLHELTIVARAIYGSFPIVVVMIDGTRGEMEWYCLERFV
jgi:hypothetical protein